MAYSLFGSSASTTTLSPSDDPHLEVTVTPSASAFYAGETFSCTIRFRNTRRPRFVAGGHGTSGNSTASALGAVAPRGLPAYAEAGPSRAPTHRLRQIGLALPANDTLPDHEAESGPSRTPGAGLRSPLDLDGQISLNSPAGSPYRPSWSADSPNSKGIIRTPDGWGGDAQYRDKGGERRSKSYGMGRDGMSPQEMVWALEGQVQPPQAGPPKLPPRRPGGIGIPTHHPHSRKISTATVPSPTSTTDSTPLTSPPLEVITEDPGPGSRPLPTPLLSPGSTSRSMSRNNLSSSSTSPSASRSDLSLDGSDSGTLSGSTGRYPSRRPQRPPTSPLARGPSYYNAYGAASLLDLPTPPSHPSLRNQEPSGITTVLWAYTRLTAHFHPSNAYIPPDPLLPLRSMLLHQPVGSGSLSSSADPSSPNGTPKSGGWQLSFGTGTIGQGTQPSLTGSLFGLAKDLVYGGTGGSLEEERKRVWNMKDLPVLETQRSLLGVDLKLKEGESKDYTYSLKLPAALPPSHRGRAYRFSYDLIVSLTVALPGAGKRQKAKDITIPIRLWANVKVGQPMPTYNVLKPIIQARDEGVVAEDVTADAKNVNGADDGVKRQSNAKVVSLGEEHTLDSLHAYAQYLLEAAQADERPVAEGLDASSQLSTISFGKRSILPTSDRTLKHSTSMKKISSSESLSVRKMNGDSVPGRKPDTLEGGEELMIGSREGENCGEAVEILSRHSARASYDIAKDGDLVAVLTLVKTTYRLGETVLGIVNFNGNASGTPGAHDRRVLRMAAYLETHELIPENLLPPSASGGKLKQPNLTRLYAEHRSAYVFSTQRTSFSLDIPSEGTPAFSVSAGEEGAEGGLEWRIRLTFLVAMGPGRRRARASMDGQSAQRAAEDSRAEMPVHLLPSQGDQDNRVYSATEGLAPLVRCSVGDKGRPKAEWAETKLETVECEVPIRVLASNTAFVVRPNVFVV